MNASALRSEIGRWLYRIFAILSVLIMLAVAAVAVIEIAAGVVTRASSQQAYVHNVVTHTLKGLELLFLAPLPYLVVLSFGRYLSDFLQRDDERAETSYRLVLQHKALATTLMVAVVATDLVQRVLTSEGLSLTLSLTHALAIFTLVAYLVALERAPRDKQPSPRAVEKSAKS